MKNIVTAVALAGAALLYVAGSPGAQATDVDDYRWNHDRADCRFVETHATNRWGTDVTVRRRVCD